MLEDDIIWRIGRWRFEPLSGGYVFVSDIPDDDDLVVASCKNGTYCKDRKDFPNVLEAESTGYGGECQLMASDETLQLIRAAPNLLKACKNLLEKTNITFGYDELIEVLEAVEYAECKGHATLKEQRECANEKR